MRSAIQTKTLVLLHYAMRAMVFVAIFWLAYMRDWDNTIFAIVILLLMLAPSMLKKKYDIFIPFFIEFISVTFIFLTLYLGALGQFYQKYAWWDGTLHFLSGMLLGIIGFLMIYILNERKTARLTLSPFFVSLFSICFSLALGVFWEIYEYAADTLFGYNMQEDGIRDTMWDLIFATVGSLIVGSIAYVWMKRRLKVPFTPKKLKKTD